MSEDSGLGWVEWLIGTIVIIIPLWRVLRKAGFQPALSLLSGVPLFGPLGLLALLAFTEWPALARRPRDEIASRFD